MSEYADRLTSGEEPTKAPELMPEPSEAQVTIITGNAVHEIDGVPSTAAEKLFHAQAAAAIEQEEQVSPAHVEELERAHWRHLDVIELMLHSSWLGLHAVGDALAHTQRADLNSDAWDETRNLYTACGHVMEAIAKLHKRELNIRPLVLLPKADGPRGNKAW